MMEVRPILSAMRRNKFGALLIATQMAVSLAFLANSLALIEQRLAWSARPTGVDEANVFVARSISIEDNADAAARVDADLNALRSLSGVVDAYVTNDYPFRGGGWTQSANLTADQKVPSAITATYFGDTEALRTLGLKLIAGRNFTADEVIVGKDNEDPVHAGAYIITKALADRLFPGGDALGKSIYIEDEAHSSPIVGIVERLQAPYYAATGPESRIQEYSVIFPYRPIGGFSNFMVRTQPGKLAAVMQQAYRTLTEMDGDRIVKVKSMQELRTGAYRGNRSLVILLASVCTALLTVTGLGIVGITSYWVTQRRRHIGIRRALGATRLDIVHYFQTENLLIAVAGAALGVAAAIAVNLWMVAQFEMTRMDDSRALIGALVLIILGQAAVFWPALRAASIPPALATRGG